MGGRGLWLNPHLNRCRLQMWIGWLLEFCVMATSKVIWGWILTCGNAHSWRLYNAAPLRDQTTSTWYPIQSHYPDIGPTSACPILLMLSAWLGSDKHKYFRHWFGFTSVQTGGFESQDLPKRTTDARLISDVQPSPSGIPTCKFQRGILGESNQWLIVSYTCRSLTWQSELLA